MAQAASGREDKEESPRMLKEHIDENNLAEIVSRGTLYTISHAPNRHETCY